MIGFQSYPTVDAWRPPTPSTPENNDRLSAAFSASLATLAAKPLPDAAESSYTDFLSSLALGLLTPNESPEDLLPIHCAAPVQQHINVTNYPVFVDNQDLNIPRSAQAELVFPDISMPGAWSYSPVPRPTAPPPLNQDRPPPQVFEERQPGEPQDGTGELRLPRLSCDTGHCGQISAPKPSRPRAVWVDVIAQLEFTTDEIDDASC